MENSFYVNEKKSLYMATSVVTMKLLPITLIRVKLFWALVINSNTCVLSLEVHCVHGVRGLPSSLHAGGATHGEAPIGSETTTTFNIGHSVPEFWGRKWDYSC